MKPETFDKGHTGPSSSASDKPAADHKQDHKTRLLSKSELSIWLDNYDDIFSSFDSRPVAERTLSDDFITEARKMAREKVSGHIELKLLMPAKARHKATEEAIIKSLHERFRRA